MSKAALSGGASGTGTVTLLAPNTSTDRTLTMPDASGILVTADQVYLGKNKIINGKMDISQRGTSFVGATNVYTLDRFLYGISGGGAVTVTQAADAPTNEFQSSLRVAVTTAVTSVTSGVTSYINQAIEGYNVRDLLGKTFTLSFWVRSAKTGIHSVSFRNGGSDRSYVMEYTVNTANTWEWKTLTLVGGLTNSGTWNWTNGAGVSVCWALAVGSSYTAGAGSWQTGNFIGSPSQVNCMDTVGNVFAITGVQLEAGANATAFEHRPYSMELDLCLRYFQYLALNSASSGSNGMAILCNKYSTTDTAVANLPLIAPMRVVPTVSGLNSSARLVLNTGGGVTGTLTSVSCANPAGPLNLNYTNNSIAAGFGWVDQIGNVQISAEL